MQHVYDIDGDDELIDDKPNDNNKRLSLKHAREIMNTNAHNETYTKRFTRIMKLHGITDANDDVLEFLTMVIDDPVKYKDIQKLTHVYNPSSFYDVYRAITQFCGLPEVKTIVGARCDDLVTAHTEFMNMQKNGDDMKHKQKNIIYPIVAGGPPSTHNEDDNSDNEGSQGSQGGQGGQGSQGSQSSNGGGIPFSKLVTKRLHTYIDMLHISDDKIAIAVAKLIEADIDIMFSS